MNPSYHPFSSEPVGRSETRARRANTDPVNAVPSANSFGLPINNGGPSYSSRSNSQSSQNKSSQLWESGSSSSGSSSSVATPKTPKSRGRKPKSKSKDVDSESSPTALKVRRKLRKNTREKQRRMELNDKFEKLCTMLNLSRKTKTEKFTILSEAIDLIASLREENDSLKQQKSALKSKLSKLASCLKQAYPQPPEDMSVDTENSSAAPNSPLLNGSMPPIPRLEDLSISMAAPEYEMEATPLRTNSNPFNCSTVDSPTNNHNHHNHHNSNNESSNSSNNNHNHSNINNNNNNGNNNSINNNSQLAKMNANNAARSRGLRNINVKQELDDSGHYGRPVVVASQAMPGIINTATIVSQQYTPLYMKQDANDFSHEHFDQFEYQFHQPQQYNYNNFQQQQQQQQQQQFAQYQNSGYGNNGPPAVFSQSFMDQLNKLAPPSLFTSGQIDPLSDEITDILDFNDTTPALPNFS